MNAKSANTDIAKWQKWLKIIEPHIFQLQYSKILLWKYADMTKSDEDLQKSFFSDWLSRAYTSHTVLGIRRLIDASPKYPSISLVKLLQDIDRKPELLTRKNYIKGQIYEFAQNDPLRRFFQRRDIKEADKEFTEQYGSRRHLDHGYVKNDMSKMIDDPIFEKVKNFTDKYYAHTDRDQTLYPIPKYQETNFCINVLTEIFSKYNKLITGYVVIIDDFFQEIEREIEDIFDKHQS